MLQLLLLDYPYNIHSMWPCHVLRQRLQETCQKYFAEGSLSVSTENLTRKAVPLSEMMADIVIEELQQHTGLYEWLVKIRCDMPRQSWRTASVMLIEITGREGNHCFIGYNGRSLNAAIIVGGLKVLRYLSYCSRSQMIQPCPLRRNVI